MITDFEGKVAVITGGSNGIGFSMAENCLRLGMNVVITGSRQASADAAAAKLNGGDRLVAVASNAGDADDVFALAKLTEERFGKANLLMANAGVSRINPIHELTLESWRLHMSVNLDGVFYAVKAFLPMLEKEDQAHIVITSSIFGLFASAMQGPYFASKAGVTAFAESLYYDLQAAESNVGVSVTLPGNTSTNMAEANVTDDVDPELAAMIKAELAKGTPPQVVTDATLDAVRNGTFYVMPNTGDFQMCVDARFDRILKGRNPAWEDVGDAV